MRKIVLAVDAFQDNADAQARALKAARALSRGDKVSTEPVYVLSPGQLNLSPEFDVPGVERYRTAAERSLESSLRASKARGLSRARVLVEPRASNTHAVDALAAYARRSGAEMIVVSTHARRGMPRLFLGSFTETLLLRSKIPVLTVGPKARIPERVREILFPTDLGKASLKLFEQVLAFAKRSGARVTLLSAVPRPAEPVIQAGVFLLSGAWFPASAYVGRELENREKAAEPWLALARKRGVKATLRVDEVRAITEAILTEAKRGSYDLIAMEAKSGAAAAVLIGSVTRQVVRDAPCPVWVARSL